MVIRVALIGACCLTLAGCANSLPSISGFFQSSPKSEELRIESDPEGAEVKNQDGATCQTPCEFSVPSGSSEIWITVSMVGYQTLTVRVVPDSAGGGLRPNPVFAKLQPLAPPSPAKTPSSKKKSVQASTAQ